MDSMAQHALFERILNAPNFGSIIVFIAADLCEYLHAERITIYQRGRHDDEIVSRFKTGKEVEEIRLPLGTGSIAGYVALSQQALLISNVASTDELKAIHPNLKFDRSFDRRSGFKTRSVIAVPIKYHNVLLGVLQVINKSSGGEFNRLDLERSQLLANTIGKKFAKDLDSSQSPYELLIDHHLITPAQLHEIEQRALKLHTSISHLLIAELNIDPLMIGKALENFYQVPYQPYDASIRLPEELIGKVSTTYMRKQLCLPISGNAKEAHIIIDDPTDYTRILELQKALGIENVIIRLSLPNDIYNFLGIGRSALDTDLSAIVSELQDDSGLADSSATEEDELAPLNPNSAPIIKLVHKLIFDAVNMGASDIHIEPGREHSPTTVRMRVDGICQAIQKIPAQFGPSVLSRIKVLSRMDISEHRKPQDGKCKIKLGNKTVELRVATLPTVNGESAVMRILSNTGAMPLNKLNLLPNTIQELKRIIEFPHGIFLVVGPTGSGKTTTLHALLKELNTPEKKIWTAEDPVEITQAGLQQVQVFPKIGLDFGAALRAFLRADPDVILIGEIRDKETAHISIEASLTGHLVFSTLHTNSASETIIRLLDLGADPLNFADALLGVLAQRLVRALCNECKTAYYPDNEELAKLKHAFGEAQFEQLDLKQIRQTLLKNYDVSSFKDLDLDSERIILFRPNGCAACDHKGYRGRIGIHELLTANSSIKSRISHHASAFEIQKLAMEQGMLTLMQDGILKILLGLTDLTQLRKVVMHV